MCVTHSCDASHITICLDLRPMQENINSLPETSLFARVAVDTPQPLFCCNSFHCNAHSDSRHKRQLGKCGTTAQSPMLVALAFLAVAQALQSWQEFRNPKPYRPRTPK